MAARSRPCRPHRAQTKGPYGARRCGPSAMSCDGVTIACEHKKGAAKNKKEAAYMYQKKTTNAPTSINEDVKKVFQQAYTNSLRTIISSPIYNIFGESDQCKVAKCCVDNEIVRKKFEDLMLEVFNGSSGASTSERETIFRKLHEKRLSSAVIEDLIRTINNETTKHSEEAVNNFIQDFVLELVGEIFKSFVELGAQSSKNTSEVISENDSKVLFYISGYLISTLLKRYSKVKNPTEREHKKDVMKSLVNKSSEKTFTEKYSTMIDYKNCGGLKKPSDNFFFMIREFENVVRKSVDHESIHSKSFLKDELREEILDSFMVKHNSCDLFELVEDDNERESFLEDCINLFLSVRGFAITKLINKKTEKSAKNEKKTSASLRDALKSLNTGNLK
ncbi:uncharacterized protein LOC127877232 [Dreissena polymorpha]|nr:uncharacterized protein LOC127877232 [Dreissena polymorpha]